MKILITGASRGIGEYLMQTLINKGFDVYGTWHTTPPKKHLRSRYANVDITKHYEVADWIDGVCEQGDDLAVINCAGANYNAFAHKANLTKWEEVVNINLIGTFNVINNILPHMREQGFGRIINLSSIVAQKGVAGTSAYAASKAALWGLTRSVAVENASKGITINNLNLGYFNIGMIGDVPEQILEGIKKTIPSHELGCPADIFNAVMFLIETSYVNGTSLDINGGLQ